jgi:hypothetical protein
MYTGLSSWHVTSANAQRQPPKTANPRTGAAKPGFHDAYMSTLKVVRMVANKVWSTTNTPKSKSSQHRSVPHAGPGQSRGSRDFCTLGTVHFSAFSGAASFLDRVRSAPPTTGTQAGWRYACHMGASRFTIHSVPQTACAWQCMAF